jgi:dipeptidyl aminopeptidase/acylaminoacyl peptidase
MTGGREYRWHPTEAATLLWVEALDGGDPKREVKDRDRVMMWRAPFAESPSEIARTEHRFAGLRWTETGDFALVSDYDCDRRWRRTMLVSFGEAGAGRPRTLFSHSARDLYSHPGIPVSRALPSGHYAVLQRGDWIYLSGTGESAEGSRPFLDRLNLYTLQSQRLLRSDDGIYETFVALLDDDATRFITCRESSVEPPNYFVRERTVKSESAAIEKLEPRSKSEVIEARAASGVRSHDSKVTKALTRFRDAAPQLRAIRKHLVTYERADGVKLSFTLYLPPEYRKGTRLPTVFWSYPVEFNDPATAGQVTGSTNRFTNIRGTSHLFFLLEGYAVLDQASMPIIGDAETLNETFVEQITMNAQAAIKKATEIGVADPQRIGCGGHSFGAFMTANLLAHTNLFRAGIALSGAYNRTLTPFGFQFERRTLWEAPDTYARVSPLLHADRITAPLLLIHGEADENPGTHPLQSERMYQAIRGTGGRARLVMLPHEGHCYAASESVEHALCEMTAWFRQHLSDVAQAGY